eukprot:403356220
MRETPQISQKSRLLIRSQEPLFQRSAKLIQIKEKDLQQKRVEKEIKGMLEFNQSLSLKQKSLSIEKHNNGGFKHRRQKSEVKISGDRSDQDLVYKQNKEWLMLKQMKLQGMQRKNEHRIDSTLRDRPEISDQSKIIIQQKSSLETKSFYSRQSEFVDNKKELSNL